MILVASLASAHAMEDYVLEHGPYPALEFAVAAQTSDVQQLAQRWSGGSWSFIVRSPPVGAMEELPGADGPATILRRQTGRVSVVRSTSLEESNDWIDARTLLKDAIARHAPSDALPPLQVLENRPVDWTFVRSVQRDDGTPTVARHHYLRSGPKRSHQIEVVRGRGVSSTTMVAPGKATVDLGNGPQLADPLVALAETDQFSPENILAVVLAFSKDAQSAGPWLALHSSPIEVADGQRILQSTSTSLLEARFGGDGFLQRIDWATQDAVYRYVFDDYLRFDDGLVIPMVMAVFLDGRLVDEILVESFHLDPSVPAGIFDG